MNWGAAIDQPNAYTADIANGATLLTIPFGHTIDAVTMCLGEFTSVSALLANRRTSFTLIPDADTLRYSSACKILMTASRSIIPAS